MNGNSSTLDAAKSTIAGPAAKVADKTGEIAKPILEKLGERFGLIDQKKSFWQKPVFYIPAATVVGLTALIRRMRNGGSS